MLLRPDPSNVPSTQLCPAGHPTVRYSDMMNLEDAMSDDSNTCFIIMPITTPKSVVELYKGDKDHFEHVLHHLHIPAVETAGFDPIPPIAKGSDMIHKEIINNLETADLVLCDISMLNPNVFFELGVRTSLNKPVCLVKDEHIDNIPFDAGPINHLNYRSALHGWELQEDVSAIAQHAKDSFERSDGQNTLWRVLGMKSNAKPYERKMGVEGKIDELLFQIDEIREQIKSIENMPNSRYTNSKSGLEFAVDYELGLDEKIKSYLKNRNPTVPVPYAIKLRKDGSIGVVFNERLSAQETTALSDELSLKFGNNISCISTPSYSKSKHLVR